MPIFLINGGIQWQKYLFLPFESPKNVDFRVESPKWGVGVPPKHVCKRCWSAPTCLAQILQTVLAPKCVGPQQLSKSAMKISKFRDGRTPQKSHKRSEF